MLGQLARLHRKLARVCPGALLFDVFWGAAVRANEPERADETLAPWFVVEHADPSLDRPPLESTEVDVVL